MNEHDFAHGLDSEQRIELGDIHLLESALQAYEVPEPDTEHLIKNLSSFIIPRPVYKGWRYWLRLATVQITIVNRVFWWVSGLLLGLGIVLIYSTEGAFANLFALLSPLLAIAGTAYIFRPESRSLHEFELLSAIRPFELLYTRLLLILTYNAIIAVTLILLAWSQDSQLILWRLLFIWFGPMLGLTGVALYTSMRWGGVTGVVMPLVLWASMLFLGWRDAVIQTTIESPLEVLAVVASQSNVLLVASAFIFLAGLILIVRVGHWTDYEVR